MAKPNIEAFDTFALLHPIEAYKLCPVKFKDFLKRNGLNLTDSLIKELVDSMSKED